MPSTTTTSVQSNETFSTGGPVSLVVSTLNAIVWNTGVGMNYASMTTIVTGAPASFTILLEGSYNGSAWVTLATTTNVAGETQYATGATPFVALRARCTAVAGGTSPTVAVYVTTSQTPFVVGTGGASPTGSVAISSPLDGNGNVKTAQQGAVVTPQLSNRYQSSSASGRATAPTAGTAIATLAVFDFYYEVKVIVGFGGTAESTAIDNMELRVNGVSFATTPVANAANSQSSIYVFYINPGGSVNLTVNAIANAAPAGSVYKATIIATRLV